MTIEKKEKPENHGLYSNNRMGMPLISARNFPIQGDSVRLGEDDKAMGQIIS